jgi:hypothetical protein
VLQALNPILFVDGRFKIFTLHPLITLNFLARPYSTVAFITLLFVRFLDIIRGDEVSVDVGGSLTGGLVGNREACALIGCFVSFNALARRIRDNDV